jgi:hypothetical protein
LTRRVVALVACAQLSCSLAFVPRPPADQGRCPSIGRLAFPVADVGIAVAALAFGTLRTFDPLCDTASPCASDEKAWSALGFGALVAAPFALSAVLGFSWRDACQDREPPPPRPADENEL